MISNFIGILAGILTTISFLPQAIKVFKTKNTEGISLVMYIVFNIGILMWLIYGILKKDIPVIMANSVTLSLSTTILIFKIKYK